MNPLTVRKDHLHQHVVGLAARGQAICLVLETLLTLTDSTDYFEFLLLMLLFKNSAMILIFAGITSFCKTIPTSKMNKINKL